MSLDSVYRLSVIINMIDNLTGPTAKINSAVDGSVGKLNKLSSGFSNMTKSGMATAALGREISNAALAPVTATFETKKALGELKSVGVENLKALESAAKDFSDTWAGTTKAQFIGAAYDIKSGIASLNDEAVAKFTEIAGITAKGTKASIAEMTSLFATGYGIYKGFYSDMSDIDFGEMFAAGIGNAANIFKTDGANMAQAISSLGAAATSAKVPMEEQFAILGMLQATMSGSEAGTKYKAFMQSAAKAGEELGLKFTDANNQLLSMPEILGLLKGKFGETMDAAEKMKLTKAFGTAEAVALIDLFYTKTGELEDGILTVYGAMGKGVDEVRSMANAINETEPDKYTRLTQQLHNVTEEIGNQLLPTVNQFLDKGGQVLSRVSDWIGKNQELVKIIAFVVLGIGLSLMVFGALATVIGGVGLIVTKTIGIFGSFIGTIRKIPDMLDTIRIQAMYAGDALKSGFGAIKSFSSSAVSGVKNVTSSIISMGRAAIVNGATAIKNMVIGMANMARQAITTAVTAMPGLIASVWSFTAALLANPITWVVIGVVALIAALILLWQNWDKVSNAVSTVFTAAVGMAKGAISSLIGVFGEVIGGIQNFILGKLQSFRESGSKIILTFVEGIKSVISKPAEIVKEGLAKVRKLLPFSDAKEGPLSTLTLSGRRVFETISTGMNQTKNLPAETTMEAFSGMMLDTEIPEVYENDYSIKEQSFEKINLKEILKESEETQEIKLEKEKGTVIQRLIMNVDLNKIKGLQSLLKLLKEIEDYTNGNGDELVPVGEV